MKGVWLNDTFLRELSSPEAKTIILCQWDALIQSMKAGASAVHFEEQSVSWAFLLVLLLCLLFKISRLGAQSSKKLLYVLTSTGFLIEMPLVRESSSTS